MRWRSPNPMAYPQLPPAKKRRFNRLLNALTLASAVPLVIAVQMVFVPQLTVDAVDNTGVFQLDGNIVHDVAGGTYDWADLFTAGGGQAIVPSLANPPGQLLQSAFVQDSATPDSSYFKPGNQSKDSAPIGEPGGWECKSQNNPTNKDDIQNAYAALWKVPAAAPENGGDFLITLGIERLTGNGDSFAGFWLLKDPNVGCVSGGPGGTAFTGHHSTGDLLLLSNFTNGGGTQNVSVFRWIGGANGSLDTNPIFVGPVCGATSPDQTCSIANTAGAVTSPWAPTSHPANTFTEFGLDLTSVLAKQGNACFASFLGETRSSQQTTATLKDYAQGAFDTCTAPVITTNATPGGNALPGTSEHDTVNVNGPGNSYPPGDGTVKFFLCDPTQLTGGQCSSGGTAVGSPVTLVAGAGTSDSVDGTTTPNTLMLGKYCWRAEYTPTGASLSIYHPGSHTNGISGTAGAECFNIAKATPNIDTKIGVTGNGDLGSTTLGDTANFTNAVGAPAPGEVATFSLFGPFAPGVTPSCGGAPVFTTTGALSGAAGSWTATTSSTYQPTAVGTYVWTVSYAGDTLNNAATEPPAGTSCDVQPEESTISTPGLTVTKTADNASVVAGSPIGFVITVSNSNAAGTGSASGVTLNDPLPGHAGVDWSIDNTLDGADCNMGGAPTTQTLTCTFGTMTPGGSEAVHVISATDTTACATYDNTATASATNTAVIATSNKASTVVLCPGINITKSADATPVSTGDQIGFLITVINAPGSATVNNLILNDPLPAGPGLDWSIAVPAGNCVINGGVGSQVLHCTGISLAGGDTFPVHVISATDAGSGGTYPNTASVKSVDKTHTASATVVVQPPVLSVVKTPDATPVTVGTGIGFTIVVSNSNAAGTGVAKAVALDDPLPAGTGVNWVAGSPFPGVCGITGPVGTQVLDCALGDMNPGDSITIHITSPTTTSSAGTYLNKATATPTNGPATSGQGTITVNAPAPPPPPPPPPPGPALGITKTADAHLVSTGDQIGFTVTVSNGANAGTATAVTLNDPLPAGSGISWSISPAYTGQGTCGVTGAVGSQVLACSFGDMAPGATASVHVVSGTNGSSAGTYTNTATVSSTNGPSVPASDTVVVVPPHLSVTKTPDAGHVTGGLPIGFTVVVANSSASGTGIARSVVVNDPLPAGPSINWSISPAYAGPGTCAITGNVGSQVLSCALGDMAPGALATVHVVSPTHAGDAGTYLNTATATPSNGPPATGQGTVVVDPPGLTLAKTADAASIPAGTAIGFTITVGNTGPDAANAALNDPLPSGTGISWSISPAYAGQGTCSIGTSGGVQTLTCAFGTMVKGATASVHVTSATTAASCATYDNTATATSSSPSQTRTAGASTTVTCAAGGVLGITTPLTGAGLLLSKGFLLIASGLIPILLAALTGRRRHSRVGRQD